MSEENKKGRKPGSKKDVGYIQVNKKIRIKIETDCLVAEQLIGEDIWGNNKYFTSWNGVLDWLIRRYTTEKLSKKELWSFVEARKEIVSSINEVKQILFDGIDEQINSANDEIRSAIKKFSL